jgi:hypothetical protein
MLGGVRMKLSLEPPRKSAPSCVDWRLCIDLKPIAVIKRNDLVLVERLIAEYEALRVAHDERMARDLDWLAALPVVRSGKRRTA